ncbi:MAG TPA: hypothetical protein PKY59_03185 [Pyrinomonadaceae bacterium]|nr:hypothetical protein [Pyrinomonadaceae bacterium]
MKFCPNCRTQYTDDSLQFCLQDGTPLSVLNNAGEPPTVAFGETETVIAARQVEPIRFDISEPSRQTSQQNRATNTSNFQPEPKKSNTFLVVLVTAFVMLLVFSVIGAGAYFVFLRKPDVAKNTANTANQNANVNAKANTDKSPTPTATPSANANVSNSWTTPEKPAISASEKEKIRADVSDRIDNWKSDGEAVDLDSYMQNYAPTVDYYNKKGSTNAQVRSDKQKAFDIYDSISVKITNLSVTPDDTGDTATAVFDKEWEFSGEEKYSAGKVKQEVKLKKINNKWLIASEKDLKLYYKE